MVGAKLISAAGTHPGLVRKNNEDRVFCDTDRGIFLVIDGIGGQAAGERAAAIAEMRIRRRLERLMGTSEERVREAITVANNEIFETARTHPELEGMACVLTLALVEDGTATIGHVGDSRLYKIRAGEIRKMTQDHSPVGEREDAGELSETDAMRHPRRNEVFRDVGSEERTPEENGFIELRRIPFEPDAALLLCSDGLSDQVGSEEILRIVRRNGPHAKEAIAELIEAANVAGGKDNVSVVLVLGDRFAEAESKAAPPAAAPSKPLALLFSRGALFFYGALLAAGLGALAVRWFKLLEPPPAPTRLVQAKTLTVGKGEAYSTIMAAIGKAAAGDTVEVLGGEYREAILMKEGVTLRSRVQRDVILRAAPASDSTLGVAVLAQFLKEARLVGFRILADKEMPLLAGIVVESGNLVVEDVEVRGARQGIRANAGSLTLRACDVQGNLAEGVVLGAKTTAWLSHNAIFDNGRDSRPPRPDLAAGEATVALYGNWFSSPKRLLLPAEPPLEAVKSLNHFAEAAPPARTGRAR